MLEINANAGHVPVVNLDASNSARSRVLIDGGPGFQLHVTVAGDAVTVYALDGRDVPTGRPAVLVAGDSTVVDTRTRVSTAGSSTLAISRDVPVINLEDKAA